MLPLYFRRTYVYEFFSFPLHMTRVQAIRFSVIWLRQKYMPLVEGDIMILKHLTIPLSPNASDFLPFGLKHSLSSPQYPTAPHNVLSLMRKTKHISLRNAKKKYPKIYGAKYFSCLICSLVPWCWFVIVFSKNLTLAVPTKNRTCGKILFWVMWRITN